MSRRLASNAAPPPGPTVVLLANTDWYLYNFRLALARAIRAAGADVLLVCPGGLYVARLREDGFRVATVRMGRGGGRPWDELVTIASLVRLYRRERPQLVHHFTLKAIVDGGIAARLAGVPGRVSAIAGLGYVFSNPGRAAQALRRLVCALLRVGAGGQRARVILQNPDDLRTLVEAGIAPRERIRLIRGSGVDIERFRPTPRPGGRPFTVLMATRLLWDKGVGTYVEAARRLRREPGPPRCVLAGEPDPGNPGSVSAADVAGWTREGAVEALGHVDDMATLLRSVDLVVLPTAYGEGVPRVLLEAAAAGLPIVASDAPGCREIVTHGHNGLLVPPDDPAALAGAIRELQADPQRCASMGAAGRQRAVQEFDERVVIRRTLEVYREVCEAFDGMVAQDQPDCSAASPS